MCALGASDAMSDCTHLATRRRDHVAAITTSTNDDLRATHRSFSAFASVIITLP
jgi:hypothetical protein